MLKQSETDLLCSETYGNAKPKEKSRFRHHKLEVNIKFGLFPVILEIFVPGRTSVRL